MMLPNSQILPIFKNGSKYAAHLVELPESYLFHLCMLSGFRFDRDGAARHPSKMIAYLSKNGSLILEPLYADIKILDIQTRELKIKPARYFVTIPSDWFDSVVKKDGDLREPIALSAEFQMINGRKGAMPIRISLKPIYPQFPFIRQHGRKKFMVERPGKEYPI
jgi:hypothetical protein